MGSPITFGGFNQIDFGQVLNVIMAAERAPLTALETQKKGLDTQSTAFTTLATKLGALQSAAAALTGATGFTPYAVTTSDPTYVGVSTTTGGVAGRYDVVVSELARAQVMASTTTYASPDEVVATGGNLSIAIFGNPPVNIPPAVAGSMSVRQLADAINADSSSPVSASVVQAAPGQYRLVLTGRATGTANAFTVTSSLTGGTGVAFTDTDGDGTFGDDAADLSVAASNAALTINNVPVSSATNEVADAIPGVRLSLTARDPAKTVVVEVKQSANEAQTQLEAFVKAYNDLLSFIAEQGTAAAAGKSSIARDPLVRSLRDGLRNVLQAEYSDAGETYTRLSTIGVEFDQTGKLKLDKNKLAAAITAAPNDVRLLFVGASGRGGVFGAVKTQAESYTAAGGLVQNARNRIQEQVTKINTRLDALGLQLDLRRRALQQEFIAADRLMTQLNGQGASLQALGGQYRLF